MIDRVRWLGESYIIRGYITLDEKESLAEMYEAYKRLGGNGHLKTVWRKCIASPSGRKELMINEREMETVVEGPGVRAVKTIAPDLYRHHRSIRPVE